MFSSILKDLGFHIGGPTLRHSPVWPSRALRRCLGLSCAICFEFLLLLAPFLVHFAPLGSIFGACCPSWLHFGTIFDQIWPPFSDMGVHFSMILGSFVVLSCFFCCFRFCFFVVSSFVSLCVSFFLFRSFVCGFVALLPWPGGLREAIK